jgi:hypothetical protein
MKHLPRLVDNTKFKFVSDLDEIGHYEIIDSRSTILKDGYQDASIPGRSDKK